jgi:hypothetical protein
MHEKFESRKPTIDDVIGEYLPDDAEFLAELDKEDRLGAVYGLLIENGLDPDEILKGLGIIE